MARTALATNRLVTGGYAIEDTSLTTGSRFFVHHSGSNSTSRGISPDAPVASWDYAVGLCTASQNDHIYLMPGHAETITGAGGVTLDVAGVTTVGLGNGSNRPTITFGNTAATIAISAANNTIRNVRTTCSVDEVVKLFNITAAHATLDGVDYAETATFQAIQFLLTDANADNLTVQNCRHYQATAAAAAQLWIQLIGADRATIRDNIFHLTLNNAATSAVITSTGTAPVDITIARNIIAQLGGTTQVSAILLMANTSGFVTDNRVAAAVTALAGIVALANCYGCENYTLNTVNKSGILDPVADT